MYEQSELLNYSDEEIAKLREELFSSLLLFIKVFFFIKEGKPFVTPSPDGRPSHYLEVCEELEKVFDLKTKRLIINIPPGMAKSTMVLYWIAWCIAQYPDCNFIYISYGYELAESHTSNIKEIISLPAFKKIFSVSIKRDRSSKGDFETTAGGRVKAFGSNGPITGMNAGLPYLDRFSGCVVMDDMHKPNEVASKTIREGVWDNYNSTIKARPRSDNVPMVFIGQRLHMEDLPGKLLSGLDGHKWTFFIRKGLDKAGNALCPAVKSANYLKIEQDTNRYQFAAQQQQNPIPDGGGLYKESDFLILETMPKILATLICVDTAETTQTWNDPTVFSLFGLYEISVMGINTGQMGLVSLDCVQEWFEPRDIENNFINFWSSSMRFGVAPQMAIIEKKNTGVSLISDLNIVPGLQIIEMKRTAASKSKSDRFIDIQKFIARKLIAIHKDAKHRKIFIDHMTEITANDSHKHDDICDTVYDAIKAVFIDKIMGINYSKSDEIVKKLAKSNSDPNRMLYRGLNY